MNPEAQVSKIADPARNFILELRIIFFNTALSNRKKPNSKVPKIPIVNSLGGTHLIAIKLPYIANLYSLNDSNFVLNLFKKNLLV